jgi:exopolysaccharide biosynthesis protein
MTAIIIAILITLGQLQTPEDWNNYSTEEQNRIITEVINT